MKSNEKLLNEVTPARIEASILELQRKLDITQQEKSDELTYGVDVESGQLTRKSAERVDTLTRKEREFTSELEDLRAKLWRETSKKQTPNHIPTRTHDEFDAFRVVDAEQKIIDEEKAKLAEAEEVEKALNEIQSIRENNQDQNREQDEIDR